MDSKIFIRSHVNEHSPALAGPALAFQIGFESMLQRKPGATPFVREVSHAMAADLNTDEVENVRQTMGIRRIAATELEVAMKSGDLSRVLKAMRLLSPGVFDN